jgi:hypothetical protein
MSVPPATTVGVDRMSDQLEWRERLESAHKQMQEAMTELITKKNYPEAERRLRYVDQLMLDLIEEMGGNVVRSSLWSANGSAVAYRRASSGLSSSARGD